MPVQRVGVIRTPSGGYDRGYITEPALPEQFSAKSTSTGSPLHYAIRGGDSACVQVLLRAGANVSFPGGFSQTGVLKLPESTLLSAYDYAVFLKYDHIVATMRMYLGDKHWKTLRLMWLAKRSKTSMISNLPEEILALIHERILVTEEDTLVTQYEFYAAPQYIQGWGGNRPPQFQQVPPQFQKQPPQFQQQPPQFQQQPPEFVQ